MKIRVLAIVLWWAAAGCGTPQFFTVTVHESPQRAVRLQTMAVGSDHPPYAHPSMITEAQLTDVLSGLYVEIENASIGGSSVRRRAFSDGEVTFFAPLVVRGLQQATPEEIVTFYERAEVSDQQEVTTSGGVFVRDGALHVLMSNYSVKTQIWQDNDEYRAPARLTPLEPIDPEPGRLVFVPQERMVSEEPSGGWLQALTGQVWHVAVRYQ